jgi:hypothetical protein
VVQNPSTRKNFKNVQDVLKFVIAAKNVKRMIGVHIKKYVKIENHLNVLFATKIPEN